MPISVSVITDEVSPVLAEGLRMATEEGLSKVDIRSIGGVNFMSLDEADQRAAAQEIRDAGLTVGTLATPLLKWPPPGQSTADMGDQFGFDTRGRSPDQLYEDAFRCAESLGARDLRVFSLIKYEGFTLADLDRDYETLLRLAERHDMRLHVENEAVWKLHEAFGFRREAHYRRHVYKAGLPRDVFGLGLLAEEWRTARPAALARLRAKGYDPEALTIE